MCEREGGRGEARGMVDGWRGGMDEWAGWRDGTMIDLRSGRQCWVPGVGHCRRHVEDGWDRNVELPCQGERAVGVEVKPIAWVAWERAVAVMRVCVCGGGDGDVGGGGEGPRGEGGRGAYVEPVLLVVA